MKHFHCGLKFIEESISQLIDDNEAFSRDATLPRVVHLGPDRPLDRFLKISVFKYDKGVAAAEFHGGLLEVPARPGGYFLSGINATSQGDALDAGIINHAVDLIVGDQKVGIGSLGPVSYTHLDVYKRQPPTRIDEVNLLS